MEYHWIMTMEFTAADDGRTLHTRDGLITVVPGRTRQEVLQQLIHSVVDKAAEAGIRGGYAVLFFSLEPNRLGA